MEEAGEKAETAERNVNERICTAESFLDPYANGWAMAMLAFVLWTKESGRSGCLALRRGSGDSQ